MVLKANVDLRRRVLDASLALIDSVGLEAFSMREVARRAGVSHQAPYHYFADREAIMAAIVAEGFAQLREELLAAGAGIGDPHQRLTALGKAYLAFAMSQPAHFKLMFRSEWVDAEKHAQAGACAQDAFSVLNEVICTLTAGAPDEESRTLLLTAWSLAHGMATLAIEGKLDKFVEPEIGVARAASVAFERFEALLRKP